MHALDEGQKERSPDVLAGMVSQLHDGHQVLLGSLVEAEQTLLEDLEPCQKRAFLRYKRVLDELHTIYQLAAFEAGRTAAADISAEALEHIARLSPRRPVGRRKRAESRSHVPR